MQHKVKMTVIDKKLYPELQEQYCADPEAGPCPCYNVGDEFVFERYDDRDSFWCMGLNTLVKSEHPVDGIAGGPNVPHCSELWDAVSRYIYAGLQGGSIMRGWMDDDRVMITCCSDGTRPVIFKIERLDYFVVRYEGEIDEEIVRYNLMSKYGVKDVAFRDGFIEVYVSKDGNEGAVRQGATSAGVKVVRID